MKCIILAAGYATRLYPLTENFPKPLLDINGKTIIDWLIDDVNSLNIVDEYVIVSNHKYADLFNKWQREKGMSNITILDDGSMSNESRCGAVYDIMFAIKKKNLDDDLLILAGDNVLDFSLNTFIDYFKTKKHSVIMRYYEEKKDKIKKSACVVFDDNDKVLKMIEKPENPISNWCVPPFYLYSKKDLKEILKALDNGCNKDAPGSLVNWLYDKKEIYAMEMPGRRYDIGTIESYEKIKEIYHGINKE